MNELLNTFIMNVSDNKMSKRKPIRFPIVKSVFLSKKVFPVSTDSNFEWSTVDQSTIRKISSSFAADDLLLPEKW